MVEGHHPCCEYYSSHVLHINDKMFCSGCTGIIIGAIFALVIDSFYFFVGFQFAEQSSVLIWLGVFGVGCSLILFTLSDLKSGEIRLSLNTVFVLAAALLLIGVDGRAGSLLLDLYLLLLIVYWIITRIIISQRNHKLICSKCRLRSCVMSSLTKQHDGDD